MRDHEYEDGGYYLDIHECSECGATAFKESRIRGVCAPCLSGESFDDDVESGTRSKDLVGVA